MTEPERLLDRLPLTQIDPTTMKSNIYLCIVLLLMLFSCKEKRAEVTKLIFFRIHGLVFDTQRQPNIWVLPYFEYQKNNKRFKIAYAHYFNPDSIAPSFGLNEFYELPEDSMTIALINKAIIDKSFDSIYEHHEDLKQFYFLFETSDNRKDNVRFGYNYFPDDFGALFRRIESLIGSSDLLPVKPFIVDTMVFKFEKQLFAKFPPPAYPF